jgi:hypothetical protein
LKEPSGQLGRSGRYRKMPRPGRQWTTCPESGCRPNGLAIAAFLFAGFIGGVATGIMVYTSVWVR